MFRDGLLKILGFLFLAFFLFLLKIDFLQNFGAYLFVGVLGSGRDLFLPFGLLGRQFLAKTFGFLGQLIECFLLAGRGYSKKGGDTRVLDD